MKRILILALVCCLCISLCACGKSEEAKKADALIQAIGEVTLESGDAIQQAKTYYEALTEDQKKQVEQYQVLELAENDYADLIHYDVVMDVYELSEYTDGTKTEKYTDFVVNDVGLVTEKTLTSGAVTIKISYEYDESDRVISERQDSPIGYTLTAYEYNKDGRVTQETRTTNNADIDTYEKTFSYNTNADGQVVEKTQTEIGDSTFIFSYTYDNCGNIASEKQVLASMQSSYFLSEYTYGVHGKPISSKITNNLGFKGWSCSYRYTSISKSTISPKTNTELNTKDMWAYFEEMEKLPTPESVVNTFVLSGMEKGKMYTLYRYIVSPTADCEKYLNILAQECGFTVSYFDDSMWGGTIEKNGKEVATFNLQMEEGTGLVFAFGITNS